MTHQSTHYKYNNNEIEYCVRQSLDENENENEDKNENEEECFLTKAGKPRFYITDNLRRKWLTIYEFIGIFNREAIAQYKTTMEIDIKYRGRASGTMKTKRCPIGTLISYQHASTIWPLLQFINLITDESKNCFTIGPQRLVKGYLELNANVSNSSYYIH